MSDYVCPDSGPDDERDCWEEIPFPEGDGVDLVSWLKYQLTDGLNHECAHAVDGPYIFGYEDDGTPRFEVFRHASGSWAVREKRIDTQRWFGLVQTPAIEPSRWKRNGEEV